MTKILAFSDVHRKKRHCKKLVELSQEADLVIGAGDFASFHKGLDTAFGILKQIEKPFVIVPGNHERHADLIEICQGHNNIHILHGNTIELLGIQIHGIGGGIPVTPFGEWSFDFTEEEAETMLQTMPEKSILISHSPPKGTLDRNFFGKSLGSTAIRDAILSKKPVLCVCGHIHESSGKSKMLETTNVVNAGPKGMMLEV